MKSFPLVALFAVLTLSFPQGEAGGRPVSTLLQKVQQSLVILQDLRPADKGSMRCTGFVLDRPFKGAILTAEHCIKGEVFLVIDGVEGEVVRKSEWLALVRAKGVLPRSKPPLRLATSRTPIATPTWGTGWAFGQILLSIPRLSIGYHETDLIVDGPYVGGMSGGPVVDEEGVVVGVIQAGNEALGLISGIDEIQEFLKGKEGP